MAARMRLMQSALSLVLTAVCMNGFGADASSSSRDQPAAGTHASVVSAPDYTSTSEEVTDPDKAAAQAAWRDYQTSIFEALSKSSDPRDWALATLTDALKFDVDDQDPDGKGQISALLERATHAAPNDVLVQWIALVQVYKMDGRSASSSTALQTLQHLEPDNAAVWLETMTNAIQRKDDAAIDVALTKMAASMRFDDHFADLMKSVADIYVRYPVPEDYWSLVPKEEKHLSKEAIPFVNAMAVTAAVALPAFQHVVNVCRVNQATGKNVSRAGDCAAIGRLMVSHGDNLLANRMGYAVLRVSTTFTEADVLMARNDDWVYAQFMSKLTDQVGEESTEEIIEYQKDWIETSSEMEAMRRKISRAGIPSTPPDDWTDDRSPFSAEKLRTDEDFFKKQAPTH